MRLVTNLSLVEFDLNDGPVVDGVYPPLTLLPAETQNMSVDCTHKFLTTLFLTICYSPVRSVHFRIVYNSIKGHKLTHFAYENSLPPLRLTNDPPLKMALYMGFLISYNAGIHPQNEVTSR